MEIVFGGFLANLPTCCTFDIQTFVHKERLKIFFIRRTFSTASEMLADIILSLSKIS